MAEAILEVWKVQRWSGRAPYEVRTIFSGSAKKARSKFKAVAENLRQGEVRLVNPDGDRVEMVIAPRLRSRW